MNTASPSDAKQPDRASFLFSLWQQADQHVPFPFLYRLTAQSTGSQAALNLSDLGRIDFVYRITNDFVAHLRLEHGEISPAILYHESYSFQLMPIQGHQGLMPPEEAQKILEAHLGAQPHSFWDAFLSELEPEPEATAEPLERFRHTAWHSLRLEQPFGAGVIEPFYKFRKAGSHCEFWIGSRTGIARIEHVHD
jgi:hypothetical protein